MIRNPLYRYSDEDGRVPAHLNFAKEVYDTMVKNKNRIALVNADTDEKRTYGELAQMTADVALSLARIGVGKGDVVCICSSKNFEYLPTVVGIMCAGAVFTPADPTYGHTTLLHRLNISRPKVMFCSLSAYETHKATFEEVGSIQQYIIYGNETRDGAVLFKEFLTETTTLENFLPVPVNGLEDLVFIIYSSGTTGPPKGVPVTHLAFVLNSQNIINEEFTGQGVYLTRDYYYTYGLMYSLSCLRVATTLVYNSNGGEQAMLEAIQKYKALIYHCEDTEHTVQVCPAWAEHRRVLTAAIGGDLSRPALAEVMLRGETECELNILQLTPMIIAELIKSAILDRYDVSTVQYIVSSSTYVREEAVNAIKQRLPNLRSVLQLYGMSEAGCICNELKCPKGPKPGSSGIPSYGFVIKVVDLKTREPLGPNQRGEICYKGPSVMKAYLNNVYPDCKDEEGFLKTGDVGYYDEDGYFYIVNRIKELIKFNDISVPPAEFEALLLQHPAVREAAVVGKPHPKHGEAPVAFIVLQPGCTATEEELVEHLHSRVTYRMRLAGGVRFIERLPRGASDKLDRQELVRRVIDEDDNK